MSAQSEAPQAERDSRRLNKRGLRQRPWESVAAIVLLLVVWQTAAFFTEDYIIPPVQSVAVDFYGIMTTWENGLQDLLVTAGRIGFGLVLAFIIGTALGLIMGASRSMDRFWMPLMQISQGIPSVSWVVMAIIWFTNDETLVVFIVLVVTLPGFAFQAMDSYRAVPRELRDMARSLRPKRFDLFRTVTWPSIVPDLLTAWKINIGLATRVVLIGELAATSLGVGFQLRTQQQFFDMSGVIAWTAALVMIVLIVQFFIERTERRILRYRPGKDAPVISEADEQATPKQAT